MEFSSDLIDERIKTNLEPPHAQNTALIQMVGKLIHDNSAWMYPTASARGHQFLFESPTTDDPGTPKILPLAPLVTTGYSPDMVFTPAI